MSRYDWSKAPSWAKFMATDSYGRVYWYSCEPRLGSRTWIPSCALAEYAGMHEIDWRNSRESRPIEIDTQWPDAVERPGIAPMEMSA